MPPKTLLQEARRLEWESLALTDINYSGACQEFMRLSSQYGVKSVVGIDFRNGNEKKFVGLAKNIQGFQNLNVLLSTHLHEKKDITDRPEFIKDVFIIYPFSSYQGWPLEEYEYIGVNLKDFNRLTLNKWNLPEDKLVALHTMTFRNKRDFNAHRLLRAIDQNTILSKLPHSEVGDPGDAVFSPKELKKYYSRFPFLIRNAEKLLEKCEVAYEKSKIGHKNQHNFFSTAEEDFREIKRLCEEGLHYRYPKATAIIRARLEMELNTIREKGFVSYFLINHAIVKYALEKKYFYVGRGSGANSIVAYLLRITDVDPIELDLYFERFINLYRQNPPDFDIDFSWRDREDITHFILNALST